MRILLLSLLFVAGVLQAQEPDLLPPEEAFGLEMSADTDAIRLDLDVADGYYLYRKRFGFESLTDGVSLGEPTFPDGEIHEDEFFGEMEIYRNRFAISIPYSVTGGAPATVELQVRLQGCADIGLCYPPEKWSRTAELPAAGDAAAENLMSLLGQQVTGEDDFLPPDEAFRLSAEVVNRGWIEVNWQIAEGYYLYRHRLKFETDGEGQSVGEPIIPDGKRKTDEFFGEVEVYYRELSVRIPVNVGDGQTLDLSVGYQGCAEDGICYPPTTKQVSLDMTSATEGGFSGPGPSGSAPVSEQDRLASLITDGALPWVAAMFFGFGILLAFTPCVLPMVPILSSIIVGQGTRLSVGRAFTLSLVFVLAMSLTYTVAGVVVAMLGQNLQAAFQHPLILAAFSAVFVLLALAMFGVYELQMPNAIQSRLTAVSQRQEGGTLVGAGVMGVLSALIVGPCVAAPLAAALIVIGQSGDAVRGGVALFALSIGMGTPLLAFGASAGKLLPKAGPWMEAIKKGFGVLLLGVAIWMIERVVPPAVTLVLWALLLFMTGVFLGALESVPSGAPASRRWSKGLGLLSLLYGAILVVGAASGGVDPLRPLAGLTASPAGQAKAEFRMIKTVADLEREVAAAAGQGRTSMLDFYADWCVDCKKMERYTFNDPSVVDAFDGMVLLKADVTANDDEDQALLKHFGIFGPPTIAFFGTDGVEDRGFRQVGFAAADEFSDHVRRFRERSER